MFKDTGILLVAEGVETFITCGGDIVEYVEEKLEETFF